MLGLAAGAVWMVVVAVPASSAAVAGAARSARCWHGPSAACVRSPGIGAGVLSACATALAAIYVNMLIAGVLIAGNMGLGLIDALRTAGAGMLWQLARMALSPVDHRSGPRWPCCWRHGWAGVHRASAEMGNRPHRARQAKALSVSP